jgi:release factor glutamine methyltransferase
LTEIDRPPRDTRTKLSDLVRSAQATIAAAGSTSPRLDAEVLLRHVLNVDRVGLFVRLEEEASQGVTDAFQKLVARRIEGEPIAYLTGTREFMGLAFSVTPAVLIPRPETELLVEWALDWLTARFDVSIVDVGTGSGAIAVSLATLDTSERNRIVGSDVSATALDVAQGNADRLLTPFRRSTMSFEQGSLLEWRHDPVDLVLANLPYLTPRQIAENPELDAEPRKALDGGSEGLDLVLSLIEDLPRVLSRKGAVGLELDPSQVDMVEALLHERFPGAAVEIISDLAGHRRHIVMTR